MATKKKKSTRAKQTGGRKVTPTKKRAQKASAPKKSAKRRAAPNQAAARKKELKRRASGKTSGARVKEPRKKSQGRGAATFSREMPGSRSGAQSGDLQGLSNVESADSESVDELMEEGNAFEAGVVKGVEDAGEHGEREVRTREVPEDDVPDEYLDQD